MNLKEIVTQLRACGYECVAGPIENNVAFIELERLASETEPTLAQLIEASQKRRDIERDAKTFAADVKAGRVRFG